MSPIGSTANNQPSRNVRRDRPRSPCRPASSAARPVVIDWLNQHPHTALRRHLERYEVNGRRVHLLNRGSLVNLAAGLGTGAPQLFDPFAAIMLLGLDAILNGRIADLPAGVQRYPATLETKVARALVDSTG